MIYSDATSIRNQIETLNGLQECILKDVTWRNQGTTIDLFFNYVWDDRNQIRADLEQEEIVLLRFHAVQELHVRNALNDFMLREPDQINWGLSEVAEVVVESESRILAYYESPVVPMHHVAVLWEGDRRIDIVFSGIEIER